MASTSILYLSGEGIFWDINCVKKCFIQWSKFCTIGNYFVLLVFFIVLLFSPFLWIFVLKKQAWTIDKIKQAHMYHIARSEINQ